MSAATFSNHRLRFSPHIVAANDDLLTEILIRLPAKSLLRFKLVSKHWLSLITNPQFCQNKSRAVCKHVSGLLVHRSSLFVYQVFDFVPLDNEQPEPVASPFKTVKFVQDPSGIKILQSCNGLLLCRSFRVLNGKCNYYIFNPTTRQFTTLPDPLHRDFIFTRGVQSVYAVNLAFDPRKSPHYKAICIYFSKQVLDSFEIEIYSSETGLWRHTGHLCSAEVNFHLGVYCNGAINWISRWGDALYFHVDEERLGTLPMPVIPDDWQGDGRRTRYFGESDDHLHLIEIYGPRTTQFNVYEMDRECWGWFIKYRVDLEAVLYTFPESICTELDPSSLHYYRFLILDVVRGKDDEESSLVLSIPGKAVRYNFVDKSFKKLYEFGPSIGFDGVLPVFGCFDCLQFIESLIPV